MIKILVISIMALVLTTGCFNRTQQYRDVPVPVFQVPAPPDIERPHLPIHDLTSSDHRNDVEKVIRAYIVSVRLLLNYSEALEEIVDTYRRLAERTDSFWTEPVFSMSLAESRESSPEISELERLRMISQSNRIRRDSETSFNQILDTYKENKSRIWEDYEITID